MTKHLPLIKFSYARSLVDSFVQLDQSNYTLVDLSDLPQDFFESDTGFIPIAPIQTFCQLLAKKYPTDTLIEKFNQIIDKVIVPNTLVHMKLCNTIDEALTQFPFAVRMASGYTQVELEKDALGNVVLQRYFPHGSSVETLWSELFTVLCFSRVISSWGLVDFVPSKINFHQTDLSPLASSDYLKCSELTGGYRRTGIMIQKEELNKPFKPQVEKSLFTGEGNIDCFHEGISRVIQLYAGADSSIENISKLINMPVRTLQRKLHEHGTSYKKVRDIAIIQKAAPMLESGMSLADISVALGYSHIPSFARAFKRVTGCSTQQWMKNQNGVKC